MHAFAQLHACIACGRRWRMLRCWSCWPPPSAARAPRRRRTRRRMPPLLKQPAALKQPSAAHTRSAAERVQIRLSDSGGDQAHAVQGGWIDPATQQAVPCSTLPLGVAYRVLRERHYCRPPPLQARALQHLFLHHPPSLATCTFRQCQRVHVVLAAHVALHCMIEGSRCVPAGAPFRGTIIYDMT